MTIKHLKFALAGASLMLSISSAQAVPAKAEWRTVRQPDGTEITVRTFGDEKFHFTLTPDNRLVKADADGNYCFAFVNGEGRIESSGIAVEPEHRRSAAAQQFLAELPATEEMISKAQRTRELTGRAFAPAKVPSSMSTNNFPVTGEQPVLVVMVQYQDVKFKLADPQDYYHRMLNQPGFSDDNGTGSARDYFLDSSAGRFSPRFDVYRPITLANNMAYYGGNDSNGDDLRPEEMAIEACQALDAEVDFSQYDCDGDGYIDNVFVIYAGKGEADGGAASTVWPHAFWVYQGTGKKVVLDGKILDHYACSNEINGSGRYEGIGTTCHEFSHVMGLPDLYTTNYANYHTPIDWSILDQGCYNNDGRTPPLYSSFERLSLGWINPIEISQASEVMIPPLSNNVAFIVPTDNTNEFFLFENRQNTGWDKYLTYKGMLVWRINYSASVWQQNAVNNSSTQRVDLIEAGGPKSSYGYPVSSSTDPFPGTGKVTSFTSTTSPAKFVTTAGKAVNFPLTDIRLSSSKILFSVLGGTDRIATPAAPAVTDVAGHLATVTWQAVDGATDYLLTVTPAGAARPLLNHIHTGAVTTYALTDLSPETTYSVSVMAVGNSCVSNESDVTSFTTLEPTFAEKSVTILEATDITDHSFTANWEAFDGTEAYHLSVDRIKESTLFDITADYAGSALPEGWTTNASGKYITPSNCGAAAPSLKLNKVGEYVATPVMPGKIAKASYWVKGTTSATTANAITVYGLTSSGAWAVIKATPVTTTATTVTVTIPDTYYAIKFEYTGTATGSLPVAIDDIHIEGGQPKETSTHLADQNVGTVTSYVVTGLDNAFTYAYSVRAKSGTDVSLPSSTVTVRLAESSGIESVTGNPSVIIRGGTEITIEGTDADATVYNLQGNIVYTGPRRTITLPAGLYIVRVDGVTAKILTR